jgi:hypothetical protein
MHIRTPRFHKGSLVYTQTSEVNARQKVYFLTPYCIDLYTSKNRFQFALSKDQFPTLIQEGFAFIKQAAIHNSAVISSFLTRTSANRPWFKCVHMPVDMHGGNAIGIATGQTIPINNHGCLTLLVETVVLTKKINRWKMGDKIWVLLDDSTNVR